MENKNEWKKVKLGEIVTITMGQSPKSEFYNLVGEGVPFLQGNRTFGKKFPSFDTYTTKVTKIAKKNDVIMSVRAPIGDLNLATTDICLGRGVCSLRMNNGNYEFLFYLLKYYSKQLINNGNGTVFTSINRNEIYNLEINIPNNEFIQKKISKILSDIDNKIELNNKINNNLETLCQNYFLELFIKNSSENCFNGVIADLGTIVSGATPSKKNLNYYTNVGIPWITPKDLSKTSNKFISRGELDISELGFRNSSVKLLPKGSVLFSSRAPIGYIAICSNEVTTNQGFKSIIPFENIGTEFLYYFLKNNVEFLESRASGSTFKEISSAIMSTTPALIPKKEPLEFFKKNCSDIFKKQYTLEKENMLLTNLKNYLLPKLMNGEIDIEKIEL